MTDALHATALCGPPTPPTPQVKALLVFEPSEPPQLLGRALRAGSAGLAWDVSRLPSRTARSYIVAGLGLLWVGLGGTLLLATEFLSDPVSLAAYYALAAACVTTGAFTTHGLAGFLRHSCADAGAQGGARAQGAARSSGYGGSGGWRFWQPFRGGTAFVLAQALGERPPQPAFLSLCVVRGALLAARLHACLRAPDGCLLVDVPPGPVPRRLQAGRSTPLPWSPSFTCSARQSWGWPTGGFGGPPTAAEVHIAPARLLPLLECVVPKCVTQASVAWLPLRPASAPCHPGACAACGAGPWRQGPSCL